MNHRLFQTNSIIRTFFIIIIFYSLSNNIQGQNKKESFLQTVINNSDGAPNTGNLAKKLHQLRGNLSEVNSASKTLRRFVVRDKRSGKKKYALILKNKTDLLLYNSTIAYNQAKQIIDDLKKDKRSNLAEELSYIKSKIYSINYAAKELVRNCNNMVNKPGKPGGSKFNSMISAIKTMTENLNKIYKDLTPILHTAIWEKYN